MAQKLVVNERLRRSHTRSVVQGLVVFCCMVLLGSLGGCHWVFGDYEVVEEEDPLEGPCDTLNEFLCDDNGRLWVCGAPGEPWIGLNVCPSMGLVCDAVAGACVNPTSTTGGAASTSAGGTTAQ